MATDQSALFNLAKTTAFNNLAVAVADYLQFASVQEMTEAWDAALLKTIPLEVRKRTLSGHLEHQKCICIWCRKRRENIAAKIRALECDCVQTMDQKRCPVHGAA